MGRSRPDQNGRLRIRPGRRNPTPGLFRKSQRPKTPRSGYRRENEASLRRFSRSVFSSQREIGLPRFLAETGILHNSSRCECANFSLFEMLSASRSFFWRIHLAMIRSARQNLLKKFLATDGFAGFANAFACFKKHISFGALQALYQSVPPSVVFGRRQ